MGRSRRTVSVTGEVAHCHRCKWSGNRITLSRELGLLSSDPRTRQLLRQERERRERLEAPIHAFEKWRDEALSRAIDEHRILSRQAVLAKTLLKNYPDCEPAWNALATFYHRQAALIADLDQLSCAKLSDFLEAPYTIERLFLEWRATVHAA
jgi:hypothetical protein